MSVSLPGGSRRLTVVVAKDWPTLGDRSWIGPEVSVRTHGRGAILHLAGAGRPIPDTAITVRSAGGSTRYEIPSQGRLDIVLPPDGRLRISAANSFRPHLAWKTPDPRVPSFLVEPEPGP